MTEEADRYFTLAESKYRHNKICVPNAPDLINDPDILIQMEELVDRINELSKLVRDINALPIIDKIKGRPF